MHPLSPAGGDRPAAPELVLPGDLAALVALGLPLQGLVLDPARMARILPQFGHIAATTAGPHAQMVQRGGYGAAGIRLRLAAGPGAVLVASAADPARRIPAALHLFAADGALLHRTQIAAPQDMAVLAALLGRHGAPCPTLPPRAAQAAAGPLCLTALRAARDGWGAMTAKAHCRALLRDGLAQGRTPGLARARCLPHLPGEAARRIEPAALWDLLPGVAHAGLPLRRAVVRPGCLQVQGGCLDRAAPDGRRLVLQAGDGQMALDLSAVAACWLTRWDSGQAGRMVLELFDATDRPIAFFASDGAPGSLACGEWTRRVLRLTAAPAPGAAPRLRLRERARARHLRPVG